MNDHQSACPQVADALFGSPEKRAELHRTLSAVSEQYRQQMDALAQKLAAMFLPRQNQLLDTLSQIDWPKLQVQMEQSCDRLANLGWALPMRFTFRQLVELAERGNTDEQVEQYMLDYFTSESGRFLLNLRSDVLGSTDLADWRNLLEQCFDAYDREQYLIPIPALLSVIEGVMAQKVGKLKPRQVTPQKFAADIEKTTRSGSIAFLVWRSARRVLDKLFASVNFAGPHPGELNRHWILHGRDHTQWTRTDVLRLFNLLAMIAL